MLGYARVSEPEGSVNRGELRERTRKGLQAARLNGRPRGRPAVADDPELRKRITQMRDQGMTLQAIADRLNEEGVPTVRGGAKWRPSSVAAGHRLQAPAASTAGLATRAGRVPGGGALAE